MEATRSNDSNRRVTVNAGGITQLALLMKSSQLVEVKSAVAGALWALADDREIKQAIAEANAIPPLCRPISIVPWPPCWSRMSRQTFRLVGWRGSQADAPAQPRRKAAITSGHTRCVASRPMSTCESKGRRFGRA